MKLKTRAVFNHSLLLIAVFILMANPLAAVANPIPQPLPDGLLPAGSMLSAGNMLSAAMAAPATDTAQYRTYLPLALKARPAGPSIPAQPPAAPTNFRGEPLSATSLQLTWTDNANDETGYQLDRWEGGSYVRLANLPANTTAYEDKGLTPETEYRYRLRSVNSSSGSAWVEATANTPAGSIDPPAAPTNFRGEPLSATSLQLTWTDNANNETGYQLDRLEGGSYVRLANLPANSTSYEDKGLTIETDYQYRLRSVNSGGKSAWVEITARTLALPDGLPAAPTDFKGEPASTTSLRLSWKDNANNETGYELEWYDPGEGEYVSLAYLEADTTSYLDVGLSVNSYFQYRLRSVNFAGASAWVEKVFQTGPAPTVPPNSPAPCGVDNITDTSAVFWWTDNSANEEYFEIQIYEPPGDFRTIGYVLENGTYVTIIDLIPNWQFAMRVIARNSAGYNYCQTNLVSTKQANTQSLVRFQNNASYPIVSLMIDGVEYFTESPWGILSGSYYEIELAPGEHNYHLSTGHWQSETSRFLMYSYWDPFTVQSGQRTTITIEDIPIEDLLTQFEPTGYWEGYYWQNLTCRTAAFLFRDDGTYTFYVANQAQGTGSYSLVERKPAIFGVEFRVGPGDNQVGLLIETYGQFYMRNGPPGWEQITYVHKPQGYQYNPFCP